MMGSIAESSFDIASPAHDAFVVQILPCKHGSCKNKKRTDCRGPTTGHHRRGLSVAGICFEPTHIDPLGHALGPTPFYYRGQAAPLFTQASTRAPAIFCVPGAG